MGRIRTEEEYEEITKDATTRIIFECNGFELRDNNHSNYFDSNYWLLFTVNENCLYIEISLEDAYDLLTTFIGSYSDITFLEIKCTQILNDSILEHNEIKAYLTPEKKQMLKRMIWKKTNEE